MTDLVIIGCGGFGREVVDIVDALRYQGSDLQLLGFVDDNPSDLSRQLAARRGIPILGPLSWFETARQSAHYVIGIGNPQACRRIDRKLMESGFTAHTLIHPQATLGWGVTLEPGAIVCAGARVSTSVQIGRSVHIDRNCLVGHDAILEDYVIAYPGAAVAGGTRIDHSTLLGTMSAVLQGLEIGHDAVVGAGAVVTHNISDFTTAVGVPAHPTVRTVREQDSSKETPIRKMPATEENHVP